MRSITVVVGALTGSLAFGACGHDEFVRLPVSVRVLEGDAVIAGAVGSDAQAVQAARDALDVVGIVAVDLRVVSNESPSPPPLLPVSCPY